MTPLHDALKGVKMAKAAVHFLEMNQHVSAGLVMAFLPPMISVAFVHFFLMQKMLHQNKSNYREKNKNKFYFKFSIYFFLRNLNRTHN